MFIQGNYNLISAPKTYQQKDKTFVNQQNQLTSDVVSFSSQPDKPDLSENNNVFIPFLQNLQPNPQPIEQALKELENIDFDPDDIAYLEKCGVKVKAKNGKEAAELIKNNKIDIVFGEVSNPKIHAQWSGNTSQITINKKYENTKNKTEILAIACAIMHEAGHAKDKDSDSSIQEELDNLALNTLVFRAFNKKYPKVFDVDGNADIIKDGVALYDNLFFDKDPEKTALIKCVAVKYGDLPVYSKNHSEGDLSPKIKKYYENNIYKT